MTIVRFWREQGLHRLFVVVPSLSDAERKCGSVCRGISITVGLESARLVPHARRIVYPVTATAWKAAAGYNVCPVTEPGGTPFAVSPDPWRGTSTIISCSWTSQRPNVSILFFCCCSFVRSSSSFHLRCCSILVCAFVT